MQAVVDAFHIHAEHAVEIFFRCGFYRAYVRYSCVVYENRDAFVREDLAKRFADLGGTCDVAAMGGGVRSRRGGFLCGGLGLFRADVDDANRRAMGREPQGDRTANAATPARNDGDFAV